MALLEAKGTSVHYGAVTAVSNVDFKVETGSVHGVIGPNGAGKSTFMDALSGRVRLVSGQVIYDGADITAQSPAWRRHAGISRSFQRTSVFPALEVGEQLHLVARHLNSEDDLEAIVDTLDLRPYLAKECQLISYGKQRSVDLALALLGRPKALLLDEPAAGLSRDESLQMLDHVKELTYDRDLATVLVEHDVDGVFRVCDTITVLHLGEVLASGAAAEIRDNEAVINAYLGSSA